MWEGGSETTNEGEVGPGFLDAPCCNDEARQSSSGMNWKSIMSVLQAADRREEWKKFGGTKSIRGGTRIVLPPPLSL